MIQHQLSSGRPLFVWLGILCLTLAVGCRISMIANNRSSPRRDINAVLAEHDQQLLAIPGVVGVYVGLLDDQKTPCLKVMVTRRDKELERSIPQIIEGYRVVT